MPRRYWDSDTGEAEATLERAIPRLDEPGDSHVEGLTGDGDPFVAVRGAVANVGLDEIIISTLPGRVSRWLRRDLPHRVQEFGPACLGGPAEPSERTVSEPSRTG